jgi:hypothetical protein
MLTRPRVIATAAAAAAGLWLTLDSGLLTSEPAPRLVSVSLGALGLLFGLGAWATAVGGQPQRSPLLAGLAIGVGGYAVLRLLLP